MRSNSGIIRLAICFAALLGSLSLVVWRQSRALELLSTLDNARTQRAIMEAQRSEISRRIEFLESRARVVSAAGERLGMRVPSADEIVILPIGERSLSSGALAMAAQAEAAR